MADEVSAPEKANVRILLFSASLRKDSLNTKLAHLVARAIGKFGGTLDFADLNEFECPPYNQDLEPEGGHPKGAEELNKRLLDNDAFIICSPEYNASMPGHLKNILDWTSRFRPQPFNERHALIMSASPSMVGGNRGLWALRIPLEHLGTRVYPDMFSLAMAHQAFSPEGDLLNTTLASRFEHTIEAFMSLVEADKHYPCIKKAWVEFLGEIPAPESAR